LAILPKAFGYPDLAATTLLTMRKIGESFPWRNIEEALEMMVPVHPSEPTPIEITCQYSNAIPTSFTPLAGGMRRSKLPARTSVAPNGFLVHGGAIARNPAPMVRT
jgi:hypothetical protein